MCIRRGRPFDVDDVGVLVGRADKSIALLPSQGLLATGGAASGETRSEQMSS